tara:strand:+ start:957 stop:1619 length:663 start_codon:yes stop_codon:yes gene_type:complete
MKLKSVYIITLISFIFSEEIQSENKFRISRIHYSGGGDWYADPSSLPNLLDFLSKKTDIEVHNEENVVKIGDTNFNENNYYYLTGHGNVKLEQKEKNILRTKLLNGAFLHADDNYGLDKSFRKLMQEIFPDKDLVEIPPSHEIFNIFYKFPNGLPKIHEHNNQRPQALGLFHEGKLIVLYTYESDLGDGWEDIKVHNIPKYKHEDALKMGANIIIYFLSS